MLPNTASSAEALKAGVFDMNMTADQARKAAPDLAWIERRSLLTGKTWQMSAENALTIAGQSYSAVLKTRSYGIRDASFAAADPNIDRKACLARTIDTVAALESSYGRFSGTGFESYLSSVDAGPSTPGHVEAHISPQGYPIVSIVPPMRSSKPRYDKVKAGSQSDLRILKSKDSFEALSELVSADPQISVTFSGSYGPDYAAQGASDAPVCKAKIALARNTRDTDSETISFAKLKVIGAPTIALKQFALSRIELPPKDVDLPFNCDVNRRQGRLWSCELDGTSHAPDSLIGAGKAIAKAYAFDAASLDPDNDELVLHTKVTIHLDPKDAQMPDPAAAQPRPLHDAPVTAKPSATDLEAVYPREALYKNQSATVSALCQIQSDLSMLCPKITTDPPDAPEFADAVRRLTPAFRFKAQLKDGSPAAGTWLTVPIKFQMAD